MPVREYVLKLLLGAVISIVISLILIALIDHQPGYLLMEIELPPIFIPEFNA